MRRIVIMGAGGRDFHDFNVVFRGDPGVRVVAFTATQIPGIDDRVYPPALAGAGYPDGIPIVPEADLAALVADGAVDEVVFAYSDVSHEEVMHRASLVLAAGADFRLLGPGSTMVRSTKPVVAVCASRTGSGKSQTTRHIARAILDQGLRVAIVRHPMPYGDLEAMRVQRFGTLADIDAAHATIEEREEFEEPVRLGIPMYAGVDYAEIVARAEGEADVLVWDGGNNDFPFVAPDLLVTLVDPLRPGHELAFHPGEVNVRMASVIVVNKVDTASPAAVSQVVENVRAVNPLAPVVYAESPVTLDDGPSLAGLRVLVVEDGPTITHGGMPYGAGTIAARQAGASGFVDPRPWAVGSIAATYQRYPGIGPVLPAMGYSPEQLSELRQTIDEAAVDVVVSGTPIDLARLVSTRHPIRRARYELREIGEPTLAGLLGPILERARRPALPPA